MFNIPVECRGQVHGRVVVDGAALLFVQDGDLVLVDAIDIVRDIVHAIVEVEPRLALPVHRSGGVDQDAALV